MGECSNKGSCKFSHDKGVISEMWKQYYKYLKESNFAPNKLSSMTENVPELSHIMSEMLHSLVPNTSISRAVYKAGTILIGGKSLTQEHCKDVTLTSP